MGGGSYSLKPGGAGVRLERQPKKGSLPKKEPKENGQPQTEDLRVQMIVEKYLGTHCGGCRVSHGLAPPLCGVLGFCWK